MSALCEGRRWARSANADEVLDLYQMHLCASKDPRFDWRVVTRDLPIEAVDLDPAGFCHGVASYVRDRVTPRG